jgi:hypothetical protein
MARPLMPPFLRAVLAGGLVVGTLDALDAVIFFGLRSGATPDRIFKGIAAGLLGPTATTGGWGTALIGVGAHYFVATMIVLVCVLIVRLVPALGRHPFLWGPVYGLAAMFGMYLVVIPHSAIGAGGLPAGPGLVNAVFIHIFGVGIPAALAARRAWSISRR